VTFLLSSFLRIYSTGSHEFLTLLMNRMWLEVIFKISFWYFFGKNTKNCFKNVNSQDLVKGLNF